MKKENIKSSDGKELQKGEKEFSDSISTALKQKKEKGYLGVTVAITLVFVILMIAALSDILNLCFSIHKIFGYVMCVVFALLIVLFIIRPIWKVVASRFFITDVTNLPVRKVKRKNRRAVRGVAKALVSYNTDPKNQSFYYLSKESVQQLEAGLNGTHEELVATLKKVYAGDVGKFSNQLILKSAWRVFVMTSVSQNEKIDGISALMINLDLVKKIVAVYGYRPTFFKLWRIYFMVLRTSLLAYGMQNVNMFNIFSKFVTSVTNKIPFLDTLFNSAVQGTVSAFMTFLIGYKTKRYLCSDYKKQEKIDGIGEENLVDDEMKIAYDLVGKLKKEKMDKAE